MAFCRLPHVLAFLSVLPITLEVPSPQWLHRQPGQGNIGDKYDDGNDYILGVPNIFRVETDEWIGPMEQVFGDGVVLRTDFCPTQYDTEGCRDGEYCNFGLLGHKCYKRKKAGSMCLHSIQCKSNKCVAFFCRKNRCKVDEDMDDEMMEDEEATADEGEAREARNLLSRRRLPLPTAVIQSPFSLHKPPLQILPVPNSHKRHQQHKKRKGTKRRRNKFEMVDKECKNETTTTTTTTTTTEKPTTTTDDSVHPGHTLPPGVLPPSPPGPQPPGILPPEPSVPVIATDPDPSLPVLAPAPGTHVQVVAPPAPELPICLEPEPIVPTAPVPPPLEPIRPVPIPPAPIEPVPTAPPPTGPMPVPPAPIGPAVTPPPQPEPDVEIQVIRPPAPPPGEQPDLVQAPIHPPAPVPGHLLVTATNPPHPPAVPHPGEAPTSGAPGLPGGLDLAAFGLPGAPGLPEDFDLTDFPQDFDLSKIESILAQASATFDLEQAGLPSEHSTNGPAEAQQEDSHHAASILNQHSEPQHRRRVSASHRVDKTGRSIFSFLLLSQNVTEKEAPRLGLTRESKATHKTIGMDPHRKHAGPTPPAKSTPALPQDQSAVFGSSEVIALPPIGLIARRPPWERSPTQPPVNRVPCRLRATGRKQDLIQPGQTARRNVLNERPQKPGLSPERRRTLAAKVAQLIRGWGKRP